MNITKHKICIVILVLLFALVQNVSALNENSILTDITINDDGNAELKIEMTIPDMDEFTETAEDLQYNEYGVREDLEETYGIVTDLKVITDTTNRKIQITAKANQFSRDLGDVWKIKMNNVLWNGVILKVELPPNVKIHKITPRPSRTLSDNSFMWTYDSLNSRESSVEMIYETTFMTWVKTEAFTGLIFLVLFGGVALFGGKKLKMVITKHSSKLDDELSDIESKLENEK